MNAAITLPALRPPSGAELAWYCLRVAARREHYAALNLTQRTGVKVFAPRIRVPKPTRHEKPLFALEALFPGYLFARFRFTDDSRYVASTPGVLGLVSFGGPPPVIADSVIADLSALVGEAAATDPAPLFPEGAWVRIISGCFQGSEGRVLGSSPASTRIRVLLKLLGQDVQISMPGAQLVGADATDTPVPAGLRAELHPVGNR